MSRVKRNKVKKQFSYEWVFEPLEQDTTFYLRPMFGGLAAYFRGRMVMVLMESPGETGYRGKTYPVDLWNGLMFPTERCDHESLIREFPDLISHPVLGKWLYLCVSASDFETTARELAEKIVAEDPRLGIYPSLKSRSAKSGIRKPSKRSKK